MSSRINKFKKLIVWTVIIVCFIIFGLFYMNHFGLITELIDNQRMLIEEPELIWSEIPEQSYTSGSGWIKHIDTLEPVQNVTDEIIIEKLDKITELLLEQNDFLLVPWNKTISELCIGQNTELERFNFQTYYKCTDLRHNIVSLNDTIMVKEQ